MILLPRFAAGQTCSCAGAPLLSSQSAGATSAGNLVAGLTYEFNNISSLYNGSDQLNNRTTERSTSAVLFEVSYGISDRFSVSSTISYTQKNRTTGLQNPASSEKLTTNGIGDGLVTLTYDLLQQTLWQPYRIAVSGGVKVPFGKTSLQSNEIALNADMQPGTGAWDGVVRVAASRAFRAKGINLFSVHSYRQTGTNERFTASDNFRFGNELISAMGIAGGISPRLSYMFSGRYRSTSSDTRNENILPNTGGKWVSLQPSLGFQLTEQLSMRIAGRVPVYRHLNGTQPTTSFALSASVFFNFNKKDADAGIMYGQ